MNTVAIILTSIVIIEHFYFLILEMFLWTTPKGIKAFGLKSKQFAEDTKVLAANQGLYNGFLSGGLLYALINNNFNFILFFLICVTIAGVYGSYSTRKVKLFYIQAVPAILAIIALLFL